ncbi:MAG TPA: ATP-binding protein [Burkholderiaceae bacterium]|nr:ATP-binding protein [Burkholderiaceae bacterium]
MKAPAVTLFWRTFALIIAFLALALLAWWQSIRIFEREPRAQAIASQIVSVVNVTRNALLYADSALRTQLLADLADNEGISIALKEPRDDIAVLGPYPLIQRVDALVKNRLGEGTVLSLRVNGTAGLWVSFMIAGDAYWVVMDRSIVFSSGSRKWVGWALAALLLSVLAAIAITRVLNQPLARLAQALRDLGAGQSPQPLPISGPVEIRSLNHNFNRMVSDLAQIEHDRAILLAGVSHDLRTPLTRLRLEIEMSGLSHETQNAMVADIQQMDNVVRQFLDYARSAQSTASSPMDVADLIVQAMTRNRLKQLPHVTLRTDIAPDLTVQGNPTELARALDNLITNALRYGQDQHGHIALHISASKRQPSPTEPETIDITVADHGPGVPTADLERIRRPFARGQTARTGTTGAGLGLAIVQRIAQRHHGQLLLEPNTPHGLRAQLRLPTAMP